MITAPPALDHVIADFHRDGFALLPGALSPATVARMRELGDQVFSDPALRARSKHWFGFVATRLYELHPEFAALAVSEPIWSLAEAVLGSGFQACGMNLIRNPSGEAISNFHVDDLVEFPLPPEVPRHDPRMTMPVQWLTVQIALSDIEAPEHGPTEFVPGSHYAGRSPNDPQKPSFEGRGPVPVLCRAGDLYLQNNQCWHRGAPNTGGRTRWLLQIQYARRWCAARFHPPLPEAARAGILANGDARLHQVLGAADAYAIP